MKESRLICAHVLDGLRQLPDESVQCVVTSPPYWGLRNYGVDGQLGLERTPQEYIARMVLVFREVRRVLRRDGTLWLNMGDSYISKPHGNGPSFDPKSPMARDRNAESAGLCNRVTADIGLRAKNLVGMPWRLALALQDDGWCLRRDIIWAKKTPTPESVLDRPTTAHEYVFLFARSEQYFYDSFAVMEPTSGTAHSRGHGVNPKAMGANSRMNRDMDPAHQSVAKIRAKQNRSSSAAVRGIASVRNRRSVWTLSAQPYKGAHFATFPEKLVEPCILAGTSERGCCLLCGSPLVRQVERSHTGDWHPDQALKAQGIARGAKAKFATLEKQAGLRRMNEHVNALPARRWSHDSPFPAPRTTGWQRSCSCTLNQETQPCTVLDPFVGSGTTGVVAAKFSRSFIGIDLSVEYIRIAEERIGGALRKEATA